MSKLVPKLRFKEFSGDISPISLKEVIISNTYGPRFNANDYDINGNVKTIRGTDISLDGDILYNQVPTAKLDNNIIENHILKDGDLVMITTADCGFTGIYKEQKDKYICSAYTVKITLDKTLVFPDYFKYFFQTEVAKVKINQLVRKATVANLPASDILKIILNLPNKQEQQKIANTLSSLDSLIEATSKKVEALKKHKKGLMQKLFPKEGKKEPELRFKEFSGEWEEKEISELANRYDNLRIPITASNRIKGTTPYYGANGIQDYVQGYTHNGEFILVAEDGANDLKNYPVQYVNGKIWVNNHAHVLQGKENIANNIFLMYAIKNINIEPYLVGGGRAKLNANIMMKINLLVSTIKEQQKIANTLSSLDNLIEATSKKVEALKKHKKGLMQQMFVSGEE